MTQRVCVEVLPEVKCGKCGVGGRVKQTSVFHDEVLKSFELLCWCCLAQLGGGLVEEEGKEKVEDGV